MTAKFNLATPPYVLNSRGTASPGPKKQLLLLRNLRRRKIQVEPNLVAGSFTWIVDAAPSGVGSDHGDVKQGPATEDADFGA